MESTQISKFHFRDEEEWIYQIQRYNIGHSEMYIKVFQTDSENVFYFNFSDVAYFEGPTIWKGTNFIVGSQEECLQILKFIGTTIKNEGNISEDYVLFKCLIQNSDVDIAQIRIIAAPSSNVTREILWI